MLVALLLVVACYLVGAVPFGYLAGRLNGVDMFAVGSKNPGATNVGRTLGRRYGLTVFALDFLKGAVPVAAIVPVASQFGVTGAFGSPDALRVAAAAAAFLGHLYPVYLRFRGGKGVATGAGAVCVLVPVPAAVTLAVWVLVALAFRYVSLASVAAVLVLAATHLLTHPAPFAAGGLAVTGFLVAGAAVVVLKHRKNISRLLAGTESQLSAGPLRHLTLKVLHVVAVGVWVGATGFFNFVAAPSIFASFAAVVADGPSDRTAYLPIVPPGTNADDQKALANALAGAAVGPVFPKYFATQAGCGVVAVLTAAAWWRRGGPHSLRVLVLTAALAGVAVGWPISNEVSQLRVDRYSPDPAIREQAKQAFGPWHLASLGLSVATVLLAGAGLAMAAALPPAEEPKS